MPVEQSYQVSDISGPTNAFAITPSDSVDLMDGGSSVIIRAIYVGVSGNIKLTLLRGSVVTYTAVPQGVRLSGFITRVWATGTTATSLIGEY